MDTVKARIQGNATVVTIPKAFNVKPGTEFHFTKGKDGKLTLTPTKKLPKTLGDLFKGWHGTYELNDEDKEWDNMKPVGKELW